MLKRILFPVVALFLTAATSYAGILPGGLIRLEDNDLESVISTTPGDTIVDVGDLLLSVAEFPTFSDPFTNTEIADFDKTTPMIMAVSLIKVATKSIVGAGPSLGTFTFSAPSAADWAAVDLAFGTSFSATVAAGTTVFVYEDGPSDPAEHLVNTSIAATLSAASDGTELYQFGFAGEAGEFQRATTTASLGSADDITAIETLTFFAAYNATTPAPLLAKHNYLGVDSTLPPSVKALFTAPTHLQLQGALGTIDTGAPTSGWQLGTDTDAYISVIPEPASMLMWAGLAALVGFGGYRRNKKLAA